MRKRDLISLGIPADMEIMDARRISNVSPRKGEVEAFPTNFDVGSELIKTFESQIQQPFML